MLTCFTVELPDRGSIGKRCFLSLCVLAPNFSCGCFWNSTGEFPYKVLRLKAKEGRRNLRKKTWAIPPPFSLWALGFLVTQARSGELNLVGGKVVSKKVFLLICISSPWCLNPRERSRYRLPACPSEHRNTHTFSEDRQEGLLPIRSGNVGREDRALLTCYPQILTEVMFAKDSILLLWHIIPG